MTFRTSATLFASNRLLEDFGDTKTELPADRVAPLEDRWKREILSGG